MLKIKVVIYGFSQKKNKKKIDKEKFKLGKIWNKKIKIKKIN